MEAPAFDQARPKPKARPASPKAAPTSAPTHTTPAPTRSGAVWPAGATTVSESYGDWTVTYVRPSERAACVVAQSQGDPKTGRRKFGIESKPPQNGHAEGLVVMPFGLAIEPGITVKLGDRVLGKGAPYTICTGEGCLVSITLPTLVTDGMRTAKTLTVIGQKAGSSAGADVGDPASVTVPLAGFAQAFDRALVLGAR